MAERIAPLQRYGRPLPQNLTSILLPLALVLVVQPFLPKSLPIPQPTFPALQANTGFALLAFLGALHAVPNVAHDFVDKGLRGRDLLKPGGKESGPWIPEPMGLPIAALYILLMMLFIPFPFSHLLRSGGKEDFSGELVLYLSSLLSLLTATLLGFIDDLFDIRWRHKLPIPFVAAVPTLLVYYSQGGLTSVVLPSAVVAWFGNIGLSSLLPSNIIDLGPIYYIYLLLLPTFTTNSINILAGINGVETLQALIIALSVTINDLLFLPIWPEWFLLALGGVGNPKEGRMLEWAAGEVVQRHLMSLYFMLPMVGICSGFLYHNWHGLFGGLDPGPLLENIDPVLHPPDLQLHPLLPSALSHRPMPTTQTAVWFNRYDEKTNLLSPSLTTYPQQPARRTVIVLRILETLRLVSIDRQPSPTAASAAGPKGEIVASTNLTILNVLLVHFGPMRERSLCILMGGVQVACSVLAFSIRYGVGAWVYGGERR
ncbi:UDP-N-acetylglucosamine--dolichyl-phosphate N-acetylglucosaminephosphotransferase, partial [Tremellales sp. Uapishka_1]